jgi:hypothetical protein
MEAWWTRRGKQTSIHSEKRGAKFRGNYVSAFVQQESKIGRFLVIKYRRKGGKYAGREVGEPDVYQALKDYLEKAGRRNALKPAKTLAISRAFDQIQSKIEERKILNPAYDLVYQNRRISLLITVR